MGRERKEKAGHNYQQNREEQPRALPPAEKAEPHPPNHRGGSRRDTFSHPRERVLPPGSRKPAPLQPVEPWPNRGGPRPSRARSEAEPCPRTHLARAPNMLRAARANGDHVRLSRHHERGWRPRATFTHQRPIGAGRAPGPAPARREGERRRRPRPSAISVGCGFETRQRRSAGADIHYTPPLPVYRPRWWSWGLQPAGSVGGAGGTPRVLQQQQVGHIPLSALRTHLSSPCHGNPSFAVSGPRAVGTHLSSPRHGHTSFVVSAPRAVMNPPSQDPGHRVQSTARNGGWGHPAQAQATEPPVDIKLSLLHRYRVKNRHNLNHKVYIFHRSNIQYT